MDDVVGANANLVFLKLVQFETMRDIINTLRDKHITFEESAMKVRKKEKPHYLEQFFKHVPFFAEDRLLRIGGRF